MSTKIFGSKLARALGGRTGKLLTAPLGSSPKPAQGPAAPPKPQSIKSAERPPAPQPRFRIMESGRTPFGSSAKLQGVRPPRTGEPPASFKAGKTSASPANGTATPAPTVSTPPKAEGNPNPAPLAVPRSQASVEPSGAQPGAQPGDQAGAQLVDSPTESSKSAAGPAIPDAEQLAKEAEKAARAAEMEEHARFQRWGAPSRWDARGQRFIREELPPLRAVETNPEYLAAMEKLNPSSVLRGVMTRLLLAAEPATPPAVPGAFAAEGSTPARPKPPDEAGEMLICLVKHLADPRSIDQGEGTWSCSAAALQAHLAENRPIQYVRLVADLVLNGEVKLYGGGVARANRQGLENEADRRDPLEDLFQDTMLATAQELERQEGRVSGEGGAGEPDYGRGAYTTHKRYGRGKFTAGQRYGGNGEEGEAVEVQRGLTPEGYARLRQKITGGGNGNEILRATPETPLNQKKVMWNLQSALKGGFVAAGLTLTDEKTSERSHHIVNIVDAEDDRGNSTLKRFPNGQRPGDVKTLVVADPQTGEQTKVSIERFLEDADFLAIPPLRDMHYQAWLD